MGMLASPLTSDIKRLYQHKTWFFYLIIIGISTNSSEFIMNHRNIYLVLIDYSIIFLFLIKACVPDYQQLAEFFRRANTLADRDNRKEPSHEAPNKIIRTISFTCHPDCVQSSERHNRTTFVRPCTGRPGSGEKHGCCKCRGYRKHGNPTLYGRELLLFISFYMEGCTA